MDDPLGILFVFLVLLPLGLGFLSLYRAVNPYARRRRDSVREVLTALGWFLLFGLLVALALPSVGAAPQAARRSQCSNNLKQIILAMHCYHDRYGCFPPAYTVDKAGRPLHGWRVLLLPFLEQRGLCDRIRLDEPYDSAHNRAVFDARRFGREGPTSMPDVFRCPSDEENRGTTTNYVMILGPRTISNGPNSVCLTDIADGPANTIAVVETYGLGIPWYEPRDLRADEMTFRINDPEYFGIASRHPGGAQVGLADGSVRFLPETLDPRGVESLTTINGGEDVSAALK